MADGQGEGFKIPAGAIVTETAISMEGFDRDLKKLRERGKKAGEDIGKSVAAGSDEATKSAEGLQEGVRGAREEVERSEASLSDWQDTAEGAAKTGSGLAVLFGRRLVSGLRGAVGWLGRTSAAFLSVTSVGMREAGQGLQVLGEELRENGGAWKGLGLAVQGTGKILENVASVLAMVASAITGLHVATGAAAVGLVHLGNKAQDEFVPSWNRVLTLIPEGTAGLEELRDEVDALGASLGVSAKVANDTFYNVLSALPEKAENPTEALQVLEAALQATASGFADGETAAKAITTVLNAFELQAKDAKMVSDALFQAQQEGVLTFQDVAAEIGKVSGLTAALGVDFRELLAIISTATRETGTSVSEVTTQLRGVLRAFVDPSREAKQAAKELGVELSATEVRSRGLVGAVVNLIRETEGAPEAISRLIPRANAQTLVISLAKSLDQLEASTAAYNDTAGNTEAVLEQMNEDFGRQKEILDREVDRALRQMSDTWQGVRITAVGAIADIIGWINDLDAEVDNALDNLIMGILQHPLDPQKAAIVATLREAREEAEKAAQATADAAEQRERLREAIETRPGRPATFRPSDAEMADAEGIERPETPAVSIAADLEDRRAQMRFKAMLDFFQDGDSEKLQNALSNVQLELNNLVEAQLERLRQAGLTGEHLKPLLDLYDMEAEKLLSVKVKVKSLEEALIDLREASENNPVVGPDVEGFQRGPGGQLVAEGETDRRMLRLARFTEELNRQNLTAEERLEAVQAKMDELGLSTEDLKESTSALAQVVLRELLKALPDWAAEMLGIAENTDDAADSTRDLLDEVRDLAQLAGGILSLASAFGVFGDEAERALQRGVTAATQLVQGINSLKSALAQGAGGLSVLGPVGAIAGGAAGLISSIGGLFGESREDIRRREELRRSASRLAETLDRLRRSAEAVRSVFEEVPGEIIEDVLRVLEGFEIPGEQLTGEEGVDLSGLVARLEEAGVSMDDFIELLEGLPGDFEDAIAVLTGTFDSTRHSSAEAAQQIDKLDEILAELELGRAFETFRGQMDLLKQEFELFDIEGPLDQLERLRETLLGMETDLPPALEQALAGADLSTAEGRRQLQQVVETLFRQLQAGELGPGDLGGLTLSQFRELLGQIEGTLDDAAEEFGETTSFQQVNTIQEVTANRMVGTLSTISFLARRRTRLQEEMVRLLGGEVPDPVAPSSAVGSTPAAGVSRSVSIGDINLFMDGPLPSEAPEDFADRALERISRGLADKSLSFEQAQGRARVREERTT